MACNIRFGERSENVTRLQQFLKGLNLYTRRIDGYYGGYTREGVRRYQLKNKLQVDGWAGCKTTTHMQLQCANHNCKSLPTPKNTPPSSTPSSPTESNTPPSGTSYQLNFHLNPPNGTDHFKIIELNYHKDINDYKGSGHLTLPLDPETYAKFKINTPFELTWYWKNSKTTKIMSGYITSIKRQGNKIEIEFTDKGALLEKKNFVEYKNKRRSEIIKDIIRKAGLNPVLNWEGNSQDDITTYTNNNK